MPSLSADFNHSNCSFMLYVFSHLLICHFLCLFGKCSHISSCETKLFSKPNFDSKHWTYIEVKLILWSVSSQVEVCVHVGNRHVPHAVYQCFRTVTLEVSTRLICSTKHHCLVHLRVAAATVFTVHCLVDAEVK